ncbi:MAG: XRE family transcriptional regulator [Syntrophomonas sp.]
MSIAVIIGTNIEKARREAEVSQEQLAELLGVTRQTIAKYIKGEQAIDSEKLFILANYFHKPFAFFIQEEESEFLQLMFRADFPDDNFTAELRATIQDRLEKQWDVLRLAGKDMLSFIPPQYQLKLSGKKDLTEQEKAEIEKVALEQRQLVLESCGSQDIFECFEAFGIQVIAHSFQNPNVAGLSGYSSDHGAFIVINDDREIPEERKAFTLVHEYGHLVFHRKEYSNKRISSYTTARSDIREKTVNHFAGCFLAPRHQIQNWLKVIGARITLPDLMEYKKELGISLQALIMSLKNYERLNKEQTDRMFRFIYGKWGRKLEPEPIDYKRKNKTYNYLVRNLYLSEAITTGRVAELLGISLKEARSRASEWIKESET